MLFTADHDDIRRSLQKFIANEINPHVDEWEKADIFPAHELFKKMGSLGFLGLNKPVEFGGSGLDYSYALMMAEELGAITCGGVPMAIGVQTDMATPALARFGSDEVRREFLSALDLRRLRRLHRRLRARRGFGRRLDQDQRALRRRRLPHQRRQDVDHQRHPGRLDLPARQHRRWPRSPQQIADLRAHEEQGRHRRAKARQDGHALLGHRADLLRQCPRAQAQPDRRGGQGLYLPDDPVPGGAALGRGGLPESARIHHQSRPSNTPATARPLARASSTTRSCTSSSRRCRPRSSCCAR